MKFWSYFKERLSDEDLEYIAYADYGRDFKEHYSALKELLLTENLDLLGKWHPREAIELTRWNQSKKHTVYAISFCSSLLLLGSATESARDFIFSINQDLIISIDCRELTDNGHCEVLIEIIDILLRSDREYYEEETPFLHLAKAIIQSNYYHLPCHEAMGEYCISVEYCFQHEICRVDKPKTVFDLSGFDQKNDLWKKHIQKANLSNYHSSLKIET